MTVSMWHMDTVRTFNETSPFSTKVKWLMHCWLSCHYYWANVDGVAANIILWHGGPATRESFLCGHLPSERLCWWSQAQQLLSVPFQCLRLHLVNSTRRHARTHAWENCIAASIIDQYNHNDANIARTFMLNLLCFFPFLFILLTSVQPMPEGSVEVLATAVAV